MKHAIALFSLSILLVSCSKMDTHTWKSDTNGPPANMAEVNQDIDENLWPPDNRTGNPAYHLRKERERKERKKQPSISGS